MKIRLTAMMTLVLLLVCPVYAQEALTIRGTVTTRDDGGAVPGATVSIPDLDLSTTTDSDGRFELVVPANLLRGQSVDLVVTFQGLQTRTARVRLSPGSETRDFPLGVAFGQEITVGSRAIGAAAEKAVPVDVITQEQMESVAAVETNQVIQALAPSFNFPRPTITDGTDSVRPATLRGLGPDHLLVLINGKRRHTSALINVNNSVGRGSSGVDMNAIPSSALETIEVLRDGAAAQYGSDAIAGVINLVLKSGASPFTLNLKGGQTTHGDGELIDVSLHKGFSLGRGSINGTLEYRDRGPTNRANPDPRDQIKAGDAGNNPVPQPNHHWGDSEETNILGFLNAQMPLNEAGSTVLYSFGGYGRREGSHGGFYRRALDARNHPTIYPLGFLPLIEPEIVDGSLTTGVRGSQGGWYWDLSGQYGHNRFDFNVANSLNTSMGPDPARNQSEFYAGSLEFNHLLGNFDISKPFDVGLAGPLNIAVGLEYRDENFQQIAGEPASYIDGGFPNQFGGRADIGSQVFPGFRPSNEVDKSRNSKAVYLDLEGDVLTMLRAGLAVRFEDYDDFGSTSDGKLTLRFAPVKGVVLRGAASTGFHAPSLSQSYFSSTSTSFLAVGTVLTPFEIATFPVSSPQARVLGAKPLKPEESTQISAGIVWDPTPSFEIAADYFQIDIADRIALSGNFTGGRISELLRPLGANGARFFTNAIDTETKGFDIVSTYRHNSAAIGRLLLSLGYNKNETEITDLADTPPQLIGFEAVLFDRAVQRITECAQPNQNARVSADWLRGSFGGKLLVAQYGEYCSFTNPAAFDQTFSSEVLTDVELSYKLLDSYTLAVGAQNLFDVFPDKNIGPDANLGIFTYPRNSPFGMNGRFVYGRLTVNF